jgi:hypothetical protein
MPNRPRASTLTTGTREGNVSHVRRLTRFGAIVVSLAIFLSTIATTATAQSADGCQSLNHRYFLGAGSAIPLRVGFVDTSMKVCLDSRGLITDAAAWQATGSTGPGTAAGFVVEPSLAVITRQERGETVAEYTGRIRTCIAQRTPICSESHDYTIYGSFVAVGPPGRITWSHGDETPGGVHYYEDA